MVSPPTPAPPQDPTPTTPAREKAAATWSLTFEPPSGIKRPPRLAELTRVEHVTMPVWALCRALGVVHCGGSSVGSCRKAEESVTACSGDCR